MPSPNRKLSARESKLTGLLVLCGVGLVAAMAFLIQHLQPAGPVPGAETTLQAPITQADIDRADAAWALRDALDIVEMSDLPMGERGGHRGSGRGWVTRTDESTYGASIASVLVAEELLTERHSLLLDDAVAHQCGDWFAVLSVSTVPTASHDLQRWDESGCKGIESLFGGELIYIVLSKQIS